MEVSPIMSDQAIKFPNPLNLLPKYRATAAAATAHGTAAAGALKDIVTPGTPGKQRLESAVKAYDGFDHAIGDSKRLPLTNRFKKYYAGYDAARLAVLGLVGTGAVPGARELVGKTQLEQAQSHFHDGLSSTADSTSRYSRYRADDWLTHSLTDAATGLIMLRKPAVAVPLLKGLNDVRGTLNAGKKVDDGTVKNLDDLFKSATSGLDSLIRKAEVAAAQAAKTSEAESRNLPVVEPGIPADIFHV